AQRAKLRLIELAALRLADLRRLREPGAGRIRVTGHAAVRRIDDDRAARLAVDAEHAITRIDPERVVTAHGAAAGTPEQLEVGRFGIRALANLAADRRRAAVRIARRFTRFERRGGLAF